MNQPYVEWCNPDDDYSTDAYGWFIVWDGEPPQMWNVKFGRKIDAQAALNALEKHGVTLQDFIDMPNNEETKRTREMKRMAIEALQW